MSKMIQIRHVPDAVHRKLRSRAALAGMTLSDYLRAEIDRSLQKLTNEELRARLKLLERVSIKEPSAASVRRERDSL